MSVDKYKLSQAMVDPIKVALDYNAIGRKLLSVDELPQGWYNRYTPTHVNPTVDSMFEIEDYISPSHWPHWIVTQSGETPRTLQAPDIETARHWATERSFENLPAFEGCIIT